MPMKKIGRKSKAVSTKQTMQTEECGLRVQNAQNEVFGIQQFTKREAFLLEEMMVSSLLSVFSTLAIAG